VIHSSASRREARPARATTLAMRRGFLGLGRLRPRFSIRFCAHGKRHGRERPDAGENLAVVLCFATRPIVTCFAGADVPASRCGLGRWRGRSNFGRSSRGRSNFGRSRNGRSPAGRSSREREKRGRSSLPRSSRFCHGFEFTAVAKALAWATVRRTARDFLSPPNSPRADHHGAIAITRRPGAKRAYRHATVAIFAKTSRAAVGPLLAATFSRGVGLLSQISCRKNVQPDVHRRDQGAGRGRRG